MKKNTSSILVLTLIAILSIFASCNKLSKATESGVTLPATPDSVTLKARVIVIDSTILTLVSTDAQLSQGIYAYTSNNGFPGFIANDIIIGITGEGYLRKVTTVMAQQNQVVLNTTQANLEDVFQQANINFSTGAFNGYQYSMNSTSLFQDATASVTVASGSISLTPNWNFNMQFQNGTMTGFSAICQNGTLNSTMQLNVTSSASNNISGSSTLNSASARTIIWIGQLPIVVTTNLSFAASVSGSVSGSVNRTVSVTNNDSYVLGDVYASGAWQNQYNFTHNTTLSAVASAAGMNVSCNMVSQMNVLIYGVNCPITFLSSNTSESGNTSTTSGDWDFTAGYSQQPALSVSGVILGYAVPDNSNSWSTDTTYYKTPYKIIKVSGDGQIGTAYQYLSQPLVVQVVDNYGNAQANVPVYFSVTSGGGVLSSYTVMTNGGGYAQTSWQIGNPATSSQGIQAIARMANGTQISGAPLSFLAL